MSSTYSTTRCNTSQLLFQALHRRRLEAVFNGGRITSDADALLLREVEARRGIIRRFADCFSDHRAPERTEHTVRELLAQRIYGLALGYEDIGDHDRLRRDVLLATLGGKADPTGGERKRWPASARSIASRRRRSRRPDAITRSPVTKRSSSASSSRPRCLGRFARGDPTYRRSDPGALA